MSARLRVTLDVTAVPERPVGAGHYTLQLARHLATGGEVEPVFVARRSDVDRWRFGTSTESVVGLAPNPRPVRLGWEQVVLPRMLGRLEPDVHHGPHYTMPERSRVPTVVTVHDLSFFVDPDWHERVKVHVFRRAIRVAARRASVIVCPSRTTADELDRWCEVRAEVMVVPHGVDVARFSPVEPEPGADRAALGALDPRLVDHPFVAFVGTLEPRKAVPDLVAAFTRIASRHPEALLVLAGGDGWGVDGVEAALAASAARDRIVRTGYVDDAVVPALLRSSAVVAYCASYEGFGLPALEALACGAPLVTTAGTSMAEVAGGLATLVPPGEIGELADALDDVLAHGVPEERRAAGIERARTRTWAASASLHVAAYRRALERGAVRER